MTAFPTTHRPALDNDGPSRPKKRRLPKSCEACRKSKRSCDQRRPCSQCVRSQIDCVMVERQKDPLLERIESVEEALAGIGQQLKTSHDQHSRHEERDSRPKALASEIVVASPTTARSTWSVGSSAAVHPPPRRSHAPSSPASFIIRQASTQDVVSSALISEYDAEVWFNAFFQGSDRFVPVFDPRIDTFASVRSRNHFLFDVLVLYGCRSACGALSKVFQRLYPLVRRITSDLVLLMTSVRERHLLAIEHIQAMLTLASYSDNGGVLCDIAVRTAFDMGLTSRLDELFASIASTRFSVSAPESSSRITNYIAARLWYGIFVLDQILSLDGGKPPTITLPPSSSHRVRALLTHHERTPLDIRLLAQVELNTTRRTAYDSLSHLSALPATQPDLEHDITKTITTTILDLNLWLSEWTSFVSRDQQIQSQNQLTPDHSLTLLNLRIQHAWATLALHLHGLTAHGIENIALMTESQRDIAHAAKIAAEGHLELLLAPLPCPTSAREEARRTSSYAPTLHHASSFVRAKTAFSILIVLRMGVLLDDSVEALEGRLWQVKKFLGKLDEGKRSEDEEEEGFTRILRQVVGLCERAVRKRKVNRVSVDGTASEMAKDPVGTNTEHGAAEGELEEEAGDDDFQHFVPKEFTVEWSFPGLNLCYVPLDWRDLLWDFGNGS